MMLPSILARSAIVGLLLVGFVAVIDNMGRSQLSRAVASYRGEGARVVVLIASVPD